MATINRVRVEWSGAAVIGGGLSTFYFDTPDTGWQSDLCDFFEGTRFVFPNLVTVTIPNTGDQINDATGEVVGTWTSGSQENWTGGATSQVHAAGVGARVVWNTLGRTNNRRVRGTTFMVPLSVECYDNAGTLSTNALAVLNDNAASFLTAIGPSFVIWTRPANGAEGGINSVTSRTVPDKVSWLRSRRV